MTATELLKRWQLGERDFSEADLQGADLHGADLRGACFVKADMRWSNLQKANLFGADLTEANLSQAVLRGANLFGAILAGTELCGTDLCEAVLGRADMEGANLRYANLEGADLHRTFLIDANLQGARLRGTNLQEADLTGANLDPAIQLSGAPHIEDRAIVSSRAERGLQPETEENRFPTRPLHERSLAMAPVRTILHPTDFSEHSHAAFELACALARDYCARLIVLHVAVPPMPMVPEAMLEFDMDTFEKNHRAMLEKVRPTEPAVYPEHRLVVAADPVSEILRVATQERCDLIVMGTHGRTGLRHVLMGSVAEHILREASCPVVTIRSHMSGLQEEIAAPAVKTSVMANA